MKMTLATIQENLDRMMQIIDEAEEITDAQIDEFFALKEAREEKIDGWIGYRDRAKHFVAELKDRRDRFQKAYSAAKNIKKRIDERIKFYLEHDNTGIVFKGKELGTLYLQKNPRSVAHLAPLEDRTVYGTISPDNVYFEVCKDYLREVRYWVLDKKKLKADLESGKELSWATLEQGKHVRVKG